MTSLGKTTPYYGGGQVANPANVIQVSGAPATNLATGPGIISVNKSNGNIYISYKKGGWSVVGGGASDVNTLRPGTSGSPGTAIAPSGGNINLYGTANQIVTTGSGSSITWTLPSAITAPGSILATTTVASTTTMTAGTGLTVTTGNLVVSAGNISTTAGSITAATTLTATLGNITATNGSLSLGTAGNKISIATGSNASIGTATLGGTPGTIIVSTTAVKTASIIFISRNTPGGTLGNLSVPSASIINNTSFVINSDANETSTINWWIVN